MKLLVEGLGELYGRPGYGWQARVARRLGLSPSYVSRLLSGARVGVGFGAIEQAVQRVPLRREFFSPGPSPGEHPSDADWRDYIADQEGTAPAIQNRWQELSGRAMRFIRRHRHDPQLARELAGEVLREPVVSAALEVRDASDADAPSRGVALAALLVASSDGAEEPSSPVADLPSSLPPRVLVRPRLDPSPATAPRLPWPGAPGRYVGWRRATRADPADTRVRFTEGGPEFVALASVEVPDSPYFQRALRRGDILRADQ